MDRVHRIMLLPCADQMQQRLASMRKWIGG